MTRRRLHLMAVLLAAVFAGSMPAAAAGANPSAAAPTVVVASPLVWVGPFATLVTHVSQGPAPDDLALTFRDGSVETLVGGVPGLQLPPAPASLPPAQWIPGTSWVLYSRPATVAPGCDVAADYILEPAAGGKATQLPRCGTHGVGPTGVQVLQGAVGWYADGYFQVLRLPVSGTIQSLGWTDYAVQGLQPTSTPGAVVSDPTPQYIAVRTANGIRPVESLPRIISGEVGGTFTIDPAGTQMLWSGNGLLALYAAGGVYLWDPAMSAPSFPLRHFPQGSGLQQIQWLPDDSGVLVLDLVGRGAAGNEYDVYRLGIDESVTLLAHGPLGYVLGFSPDGAALWREEGVAPTVASGNPGSGPFWLEETALRTPPPRPVPLPPPITADGTNYVSVGPQEDEVAASLLGGDCIVGLQWRSPVLIPHCPWIAWIPQSQWVVYEQLTVGTIAYTAEDLTTGETRVLPCPGSDVQSVDPAPGPAVAYDCGTTLSILQLGGERAGPATFPLIPATFPGRGGIALDPSGQYVALVVKPGDTQIYRIPSQTKVPGAFLKGGSVAMSWSPTGMLAIATGNGLGLWTPGQPAKVIDPVRYTNVLSWTPDGARLFALSSYTPNPGDWVVRSMGEYAPFPDSQVLAISADGAYAWLAECHGEKASTAACELSPELVSALSAGNISPRDGATVQHRPGSRRRGTKGEPPALRSQRGAWITSCVGTVDGCARRSAGRHAHVRDTTLDRAADH